MSEPTQIEIYVLALGALAAAIVTVAFDSRAPLVVALVVVALVPWAIIAAGHRLPLWLFMVATVVPSGVILIRHQAGAVIFFGILAVCWVASVSGRRGPVIAAVAATAVLPLIHELAKEGGAQESGSPYFLIGIGIGALSGMQFNRQRRLVAEVEWSHQRLRDAAAAEERRRIAREIHDLLAHSLTVVVLNLSGARKTLATHPDLADEALQRAEQTGRDSLNGIRRIVGLLREADDHARGAASPHDVSGVTDVEAIVAAQREAGSEVTLEMSGDRDMIGPLAGSAVARVVREALTNAERHAPGASIEIRVVVDDSQVAVHVHNGATHRSALDHDTRRQGFGLVGMRERVEALGGSFTAGPQAGGGWTVSCTIPLSESARETSRVPTDLTG